VVALGVKRFTSVLPWLRPQVYRTTFRIRSGCFRTMCCRVDYSCFASCRRFPLRWIVNPIGTFRSSLRNFHLIRRVEQTDPPSWTSGRKWILSRRSCLLARTTLPSCWTAWVFRSPLRESRFTLRSRKGFCFLNKNFPIIGYPSIKCECVAQVGCSIDRRWYYHQTLAERTLGPFVN